MRLLRQFIKDILTTSNGECYDMGRACTVVCILALIVISLIDVLYNQHTFAMQDFGIAVGVILGGSGVNLALKAKTEPQGG